MTQQETVDRIVQDVLIRVYQYDEGRLTREHLVEGIRSIVKDNVQQFFDDNSIDIHEVGLFDEDNEYVDDEEDDND